jgi:PAS domain S-box-containing protein
MSDTTRVNLHCHSNLSDGYLSPEAVAEQMAAADVRCAALTDHDTIAGLARFRDTLARFGIGCISGVEISARVQDRDVHLLAYGFDPEHPAIRQLLESLRPQGDASTLVYSLKGSWSRIRGTDGNGAANPTPDGSLPSAADAISAVHQAGGRVFLAHPFTASADPADIDRLVAELKAQGLDGIEALYTPYPAVSRQLLIDMARKYDLLVSAGTDYHGPTTPGLSLPATEMPTGLWKAFRKAVTAPRRRAVDQRTDAPAAEARPRGPGRHWRAFFSHIVLPTVLAICLFVVAVFALIVPAMRDTLLDRKREVIRELTQSAWSILAEYEKEAAAGLLSRDEAQRLAVQRVQYLRYGKEGKDYFWITDTHPRMIMHPYRPDLNGKDLTDFTDPRGNRIFVEFVNAAKGTPGGYVEYVWQWKDQPERLAPKESYVKGFEPWGWVIGTGMYIEDVQAEIGRLLGRLLWILVGIIAVVAVLLAYIVRQSMKIEQHRTRSDVALRESHEKYRALVEVTTEGIVMVLDGRCAYLNHAMLEMLGYHEDEALLLDLHDLFPQDDGPVGSGADALAALLDGRPVVDQFEARLRRKNGESVDVVLAATKISFAGRDGVILIAKDVTPRKQVEDELLGARRISRALADQIGVGVFRVVLGRRPAFVEANAVARRLFGLADVSDLSATDLLNVFLEPKVGADLLRDMGAAGSVTARIAQLKPQKGHAPVVSLSLVAVKDEDGAVTHWDGMVQDVTAQKKLELQRETLIAELQTSLMFLNDPIKQAQHRPPTCGPEQPIGKAADQMTRQGSSALFVTSPSGAVLGIVTDRDFRERVAAKGLNHGDPVCEIMSAPLVSIPDTALVYEAILTMREKGKRHLAVKDASGTVTGLVTNVELLHFDRYSSVVMTREISRAGGVEEIAAIHERLPRLVAALVESGAKPRNVTRVITAALDATVNRLVVLAAERLGPPPAPFVFVALGSEGREEKTLVSDQDNAIVYADVGPDMEPAASAYFLQLGTEVCDGLAKVGYPYCKGGVMAKTPRWCRPLSDWKEYFGQWIESAKPQDFLEINMFFDFRATCGASELLAELRDHIDKRLRLSVPFFVNYAQNALLYKPPLGFFGGILPESVGGHPKAFNVKDAIRPIVVFARLYALQHGVRDTHTLDRLQRVLEKGAIKRVVHDEAVGAYNHLMQLRVRHQVLSVVSDGRFTNDIDPQSLTPIEGTVLKQAFHQVGNIQKQIQQDFIASGPTL